MKKLLSIALTFVFLLSISIVAYADENVQQAVIAVNGAEYTYISSAKTVLTISSSGYATVENRLSCNSNVDQITVSTYLQKYSNGSWTTVKHWTDTVNDDSYVGGHSRYVVSGYNYRARTYFYAYDGSNSESTNMTDYESY